MIRHGSPPPSASDVLSRLPPGVGAALRTASELGQMRHLERFIPVPERLAALFPSGLPRGAILAVRGGAAVSVTAAMVSSATREGSWLAMVDLAHAGYGAFAEAGVALERVVSVRTAERGIDVLGALVGGFDLVVAGAVPRCTPSEARRLAARVRAEACVVIVVGAAAPSTLGLDAAVSCGPSRWNFDAGARARRVTVSVAGRGAAAGRRSEVLCLP